MAKAKTRKRLTQKTILAVKDVSKVKFSTTHRAKPSDWTKITVTLTFVLLMLLFTIMNELLLVGMVALIGLTIIVISTARPYKLKYSLDHKGITINERHYFWHEFRAFSLTVTPEDVKINLLSVYRLELPTIIHVPYQEAGAVVSYINQILPQQKSLSESLTDLFLRATRL